METRLILQRKLCEDTWQVLPSDDAAAPADVDLLLTLPQWQARRAEWHARSGGRLGVRLEPADDPEALQPDLPALALIAVHFPAFTDGRGYSTARLLRERLAYRGELRAIGDVFRDQLFYLSRVGFDAFLLREGESAAEAVASLDDFSEAYQTSVERPLPLFRRRLA